MSTTTTPKSIPTITTNWVIGDGETHEFAAGETVAIFNGRGELLGEVSCEAAPFFVTGRDGFTYRVTRPDTTPMPELYQRIVVTPWRGPRFGMFVEAISESLHVAMGTQFRLSDGKPMRARKTQRLAGSVKSWEVVA